MFSRREAEGIIFLLLFWAFFPALPECLPFQRLKGKAPLSGEGANLGSRMSSYFQKQVGKDLKTLTMLERDLELKPATLYNL